MATYYLDYENGNDSNDGLSWATAWKTITNGATAARIAPGDVIRIAKSPSPTSIGNGTWTNAPATLPSSKNIGSSTNATPIVITITNHGYSTGDIVYIQNHTVNLTANGTWSITVIDANSFSLDGSSGIGAGGATGNCTKIDWHSVKLATAQTKTITRCEQAWTAANGSTVTLDTTQYKEGDASVKIVKSTPSASTLYAYFPISATDFSSYQKISFWIYNATAITANQWKLALCSDSAGTTIVDEFPIPNIPSTTRWLPLTIARSGGGNLGSSIQSIALYSDTSPGSTSGIYLDNIIACTTDGLNLQSLISKNSAEQGGTEGWYAIQSISEDGKIIRLDKDTNTLASSNITSRGGGYSGTTETVTTYKRETIKTALASSSSTIVQEVQDSGTSGNNIEFQGGWNTSTNVQDGETFFDGLNGYGYGLYLSSKSYVTLNYLNVCRYYYGVYYSSSNSNSITTLSNANNNNYGVSYSSSNSNSITTLSNANNNTSYGVYYYSSSSNSITTLSNANNNTTYGVYYYSSSNNSITTLSNANNNTSYGVHYYSSSNSNSITTLSNANNNNYGVSYSSSNSNSITTLSNANNNNYYGVCYNYSHNNIIYSLTTTGNSSAGIYNDTGKNYIHNALISETTEVTGFTNFANACIFSQKHDQTANNHAIFTDGGQIHSDTSIRHTASGISWRLDVTSTNRSSTYPLELSIAKIACVANQQVTVKAWFRRSNTGITGRLICKGGQIAGVNSDVYTDMTASADTWEELSISFTPTEAGVVEIKAQAWGGTTYSVWVDDMTITQA